MQIGRHTSYRGEVLSLTYEVHDLVQLITKQFQYFNKLSEVQAKREAFQKWLTICQRQNFDQLVLIYRNNC